MTLTESPSRFVPRIFFGTASRLPSPALARHTLVVQVWPSTVATTGVRPHGCVGFGAWRFGISAKYQAAFPL